MPPEWQLSESEIKEIEAGKIVSHHQPLDNNLHSVEAFVSMKASVAQVFSVLMDYEKLPEYAPYVEKIDVLQESYNDALVNFTLALPFGVEKRYRLRLFYETTGKNMKMTWKSVPWPEVKVEDSIISSGYWYLKKIEGSEMTWVAYKTTTDSGHVPFGLGWIVDHMSTVAVLELLRKTKERAEGQSDVRLQRRLHTKNAY